MPSPLDFLKYGRKLPNAASVIDNVVNPNTYKALFGQVDDVLQRALPGKFQGAGIQNAPTNLIGQVSDVAKMPPGAAREAARNQLQRNFQMASRLDDAARPLGGQASTGALRAPQVPGATRSYDLINPRGARATTGPFQPNLNATFQGPGLPPSKIKPGPIIPSGGQKVQPITAFGGTNPIVGNTPIVTKGTNKNLIQQISQYAPKGPMGLLGRSFQAFEGAQVINNLRQGNYGQAALNAALMFPGKTLNAVKGVLPAGGLGVAGLTGLGLTALELGAPATVADGTMDSPEAKRAEELYRTQQYDREQGADLDMEAIRNLPGGSANPLPSFNPNQDLPASAEQSIDTNPMQYQMALYEQGRGAAKTQAEMNQVRDVGLAIHKAHNPHLYSNFQTPMASDRTFNPQMSGIKTSMFPEGYPATMEGFVKGGGVQMPYTMTDKDARTQVIEGNKKQGLAQLAQATQILEEQAFMQEYLKELEKKKK